jgi:hypothetical protein
MKLLETCQRKYGNLGKHEEEIAVMPTESFVCATDSLKAIQPNNFLELIIGYLLQSFLNLSAKKRLHAFRKGFYYYPLEIPLIIAFTIIIQYLYKMKIAILTCEKLS